MIRLFPLFISGIHLLLLLIISVLSVYASEGKFALAANSGQAPRDTTRVIEHNKKANAFFPDYPDSVLKYAKVALNISVDIGYTRGICQSFSSLGKAYMLHYNYEEALLTYYKGLDIAKENNLSLEQAQFFVLIGQVAQAQGEYSLALNFNNRALRIFQNFKATSDLAALYNSMGDCYFNMEKHYRALEHYEMAYEQVKRRPGNLPMDLVLFNIGRSHFKLQNFEKALIYLSEVQTISSSEGSSRVVLGNVLNTMGAIFLQSEDIQGAESFFNKALIIALQKNDLELQIGIYENMIDLNFRKNDAASVYQHHRTHRHLKDSIHRTRRKQRVSELMIKYQTQLKESEIEQLSQSKRNQKYIMLGILLIGILLLVIFFQILRHYRAKQKLAESTIERYRIEQEKLKKEIEAKFKEKESVKSQLEAAKHEHDKLMVILRNTSEEKKEILRELETNNVQILKLEQQLEDRNEEYESEQLFFSLKSQLDMLIQGGAKTSKSELKRIRELIGNLIVEHKNKDFFRKLKETYPKLSNEDLRLCAFMRNHFSNAEIAEFLEITQDTLYTRKHRLKRKLELDKDVDIAEFLLEFDDIQLLK